ncbi:Uncharacterised protein [Mycobacteroides abscessus subsp. abscessus]|nr:Uncharacterised protein [Mycobacteroides abscessus subsp. abscessus]
MAMPMPPSTRRQPTATDSADSSFDLGLYAYSSVCEPDPLP